MTNAELAVLSLVVERPRHAYEIDQVIENRGMRDWTDVGFSSIYYLLHKLQKAEFIEATSDAATSKGPARTIYSVTAAGFAAWTEASLESLAMPQTKTPFLLGLTGLGALPLDRALAAARECLCALDDRLASFLETRPEPAATEWFVEESLAYSEQSLRFGRDWLAGFVARLEHRIGEI
ncbi:MAG TPA: PadR family transcriptional regulator [Coriobacteriia bacterium]|nr:PadR family transcriptional regulator [Coriobacteriia bacterium]